MSARRLFPEGTGGVGGGEIDTRRCACKDAGPRRVVDLAGIPHRLEKETSANKDTAPEVRWIVRIPHWLGRRTKH